MLPIFSAPVHAAWGKDCLWSGSVRTIKKISWLGLHVETQQVPVTDVATLQGIECAFLNVVTTVAALGGVLLFIMLMVGGFKFLTSGGDQKQVEQARGTLTHAVAGLAILIASYVIIQLISTVTGAWGIESFKIVEP